MDRVTSLTASLASGLVPTKRRTFFWAPKLLANSIAVSVKRLVFSKSIMSVLFLVVCIKGEIDGWRLVLEYPYCAPASNIFSMLVSAESFVIGVFCMNTILAERERFCNLYMAL